MLPECDDKQALSEKFNNFFNDKVNNIRSIIENKDLPESCEISSFNGPDCLTSLANVTQDEIKAVVRSSSNKHGHNVLKNYRPVSNLPYLSKIMEKIVASQLEMHLDCNRLHSPMQSAYKKSHSAETAILMIHNDIAQNLDDGKSTILRQLDLSAAFDTVDHSILLKRLKDQFRTRDKALKWFAFYQSDRYQKVVIGDAVSSPKLVVSGVPQGSVLRPKLFSVYLKSVDVINTDNGFSHHIYADDIQIYITASLDSTENF